MKFGPPHPVQVIGGNLRIDVAAGEVIRKLTSHQVRCLLLKGPAIATWLYDRGGERDYGDCDLLVDPGSFEQASLLIASLGYDKDLEEIRPKGLLAKTQDWVREKDGVRVELHRYLVGVKASPQVAFEEFFHDSVAIDLRGTPVPALGSPARTLHLALHAAQHGTESRKALEDLERGIIRLPRSLWRDTVALAERLKATEALVAGLSLVDGGGRLINELGLPTELSREVALRASTPDTFSLGIEWLAQADGLQAKSLYLLRKVFSSPEFIRTQAGEPSASGLRLAYLYVLRWVSLVRRAPRGFATWFAAWRTSRSKVPRG